MPWNVERYLVSVVNVLVDRAIFSKGTLVAALVVVHRSQAEQEVRIACGVKGITPLSRRVQTIGVIVCDDGD